MEARILEHQDINDSLFSDLQHAVEGDLAVLRDLHKPLTSTELTDHSKETGAVWLKQIQQTQSDIHDHEKNTIIAITGSSGTGKSTLFYALLDETALIPMSCIKACTAIPSEVSFNHENDTICRAEIIFLTKDEWREDLTRCLRMLEAATKYDETDDPDSSIDLNKENKEIFTKIQSLYPFFRERILETQLAEYPVDHLMQDVNMIEKLGEIITSRTDEAIELREGVEEYVARREHSARNTVQLRPVVKKIRIFTKSEILTTGAVLVDVPGFNDTNPARVEAAKRYIQHCASPLVVAESTRAATDELAHQFLRGEIGKQLLRDQNLIDMTFICTKADNFDENAVVREFRHEKQFKAEMQIISNDIKQHEKEIKFTNVKLEELEDQLEEATADLSRLQDKVSRLGNSRHSLQGTASTVVSSGQGKHSRNGISDDETRSLKRVRRQVSQEDSSDGPMSIASPTLSSTGGQNKNRIRLMNMDDAEEPSWPSSHEQLKQEKESAQAHQSQLHRDKVLLTLTRDRKLAVLKKRKFSGCFEQRNIISKSIIEESFEESFAGLLVLRADNRPTVNVFHVSSQQYTKFLEEDHDSIKLSTVEVTGIPRLRSHLMNVALSRRRVVQKMQLKDLGRTLTHFSIRSLTDITKRYTLQEAVVLSKGSSPIPKLRENISRSTDTFMEKFNNARDLVVSDMINNAVPAAVQKAKLTIEMWAKGKPKPTFQRLHWVTNHHAMTLEGDHPNARRGRIMMNETLIEPFKRKYSAQWYKKFFNSDVPNLVQELYSQISQHESDTQEKLSDIAATLKLTEGRTLALKGQRASFKESVRQILERYQGKVKDERNEIDRIPEKAIKGILSSVYKMNAKESGHHILNRIRDNMEEELTGSVAITNFGIVANVMTTALQGLSKSVESEFSDCLKRLGDDLEEAVVNLAKMQASEFTQFPRPLRDEIEVLLGKASELNLIDKHVQDLDDENKDNDGQDSDDEESEDGAEQKMTIKVEGDDDDEDDESDIEIMKEM